MCHGHFSIGGATTEETSQYNIDCGAIIGIQPAATIESDTGNTTILAIANDGTYGTVTGSGTYSNWGDPVTLTATPSTGYIFKQWSDGCRDRIRYVIPSDGIQTYTAIFKPLDEGNISYCEPNPDRYSYYEHFTNEWGILLPYALLTSGYQLDAVSFKAQRGTYRVRVYRGGTRPLAANRVYNGDPIVITSNSEYVTTTLPNPIAVNDGDSLWITLYSTDGIPCGSAYVDITPNGFWALYNGVWQQFNNSPFLIYGHFINHTTVPVSNLTVTNISGSGATVSWTAPADASPTGYTLAYGVGYIPEQMRKLTVSATTASLTGLANNTDYELFNSMCNEGYGYGGMISIDMGTAEKASRIMEIMQQKGVGYLAVSLGYFKTLFSNSGKSISSEVPEDIQKEMGMSEGLIRFSMGLDNDIEATFQLIKESVEESNR